jgi:hypothetical protein
MRGGWRDALAASAVALVLAAGGAAFAGDTMKLVAAAVALPEDTEPKELSGLVYGTRVWTSQVRSIRLKELPEEGAKEVTWVLVSSSTQSRLQRVDVEVFLLDEQDARLASAHQTIVMTPGSERAEQKLRMKLPEGSWAKARSVRIEVRFKVM